LHNGRIIYLRHQSITAFVFVLEVVWFSWKGTKTAHFTWWAIEILFFTKRPLSVWWCWLWEDHTNGFVSWRLQPFTEETCSFPWVHAWCTQT